MKILLANKFFHLNGGSERVFFQEREFLLNNGIKILDFSMKDERNFPSHHSKYFIEKIDYNVTRGLWGKLRTARSFVHSHEAIKKIELLIHHEQPDIAHLHNIYHQITPSIIPILHKHGVKVTITLHDYKLICPSYIALNKGKICSKCKGKHFYNTLFCHCQRSRLQETLLMAEGYYHLWKKSYEAVDTFIAPSGFLANLVSQRIDPAKIEILPNGIDIAEYTPHFDDQGYGLYFGRLVKEKGIETLLQAQELIKTICPLLVVGTGPLADELKAKYPDVQFLGYKTGGELKSLIQNAAYVVAPSEWYENCSMVVLEAMALGKPVIGSDTGGIPEQIIDGETGYLFPMGDSNALAIKMNELSRNKNMRFSMGVAARQKAENDFSLKSHCKQLLELYSRLMKAS